MNLRSLTPALLSLMGAVVAVTATTSPAPAPAGDLSGYASAVEDEHAGRYEIDAVHSSVMFGIRHLGVAWNRGRLNSFRGDIVLDPDPKECSVSVEIDMDSVDTANADRDKHIKGPDFFNTVQFPKATFSSKQVKKGEGDTYEVIGELELHGETKPATLHMAFVAAADGRQGYKAGFEARGKINRREFGIETYPDEVLSGDVELWISIEAKRVD